MSWVTYDVEMVERIPVPSLHYQKHMTGVCKHQPLFGFVVEGEGPRILESYSFCRSLLIFWDGVVVLGKLEERKSAVVEGERGGEFWAPRHKPDARN